MMKKLLIISLLLTTLLFCCSCVNNCEDVSSDENLSELFKDTTTTSSSDELPMDISDAQKAEMTAYSVQWITDNDNYSPEETREIVYSGEKIHLTAKYENVGVGDLELGAFIYLQGVRQNFNLVGQDEETQMYIFTLKEGESKDFEFEFTPNTGKKGDVLELELSDMTFPSYCVNSEDSAQGYAGVHSGFDTENIKVIFKTDSSLSCKIAQDYGGVEISTVDPLIRRYCQQEDDEGNLQSTFGTFLNVCLYKEKPSEIFDPDEYTVVYTDVEVQAKKNQPLTINLSGIEGEYRVAFYINHTVQNVFDGCDYADVKVEKDKQTEIVFELDTALMEKFNHCYYTVYKLDDGFDKTNSVIRTSTEKFIVK